MTVAMDIVASATTDLPAEIKLKLLLMDIIDAGASQRYHTLQAAALATSVDRTLLSKIRHGHYTRCSISSLLSIACRLGIGLRIHVQLAGSPKV